MRIDIIKQALTLDNDLNKLELVIAAYNKKRMELRKLRESLRLDPGLFSLWGDGDHYVKVGKNTVRIVLYSGGTFDAKKVKIRPLV